MNRPIKSFRLRNVLALATFAATGSSLLASGSASEPTLPGATESIKLADRTSDILRELFDPGGRSQASTADASADVSPFNLDTRKTMISFSVLPDSRNLRNEGIDEVGRPVRINAATHSMNSLMGIVFRDPESLRVPAESRFARDRVSYSVLSGGMTINDLLSGDSAEADTPAEQAGAQDSGPSHNFKGDEVEPASLPYFTDFESGDRGIEWNNASNVTELQDYGSFTGPFRRAKEVLHIRTDPGESYVLQIDLYLIGIPDNADIDRSGDFSIAIDGVPMLEQKFGTLREMSKAESGDEEHADGNIIRHMQLTFSASSGVVEITIEGNTGPGFGTGSWGFDNVLVDEAPETNLGSFASADFAGESEIIGDPLIRNTATNGLAARAGATRAFRPRAPRAFRDSQNLRDEQIGARREFLDMFPDLPVPPDEDPDEEDPPVEETPDEEIPSPGTVALLLIGAGAASLRRRR